MAHLQQRSNLPRRYLKHVAEEKTRDKVDQWYALAETTVAEETSDKQKPVAQDTSDDRASLLTSGNQTPVSAQAPEPIEEIQIDIKTDANVDQAATFKQTPRVTKPVEFQPIHGIIDVETTMTRTTTTPTTNPQDETERESSIFELPHDFGVGKLAQFVRGRLNHPPSLQVTTIFCCEY